MTVPELDACGVRSRENVPRSTVFDVCAQANCNGRRSWSKPSWDATMRQAMSRPTTGAFLNWFPLVPIAT